MIVPNLFLTVTSHAGISIAQIGSLALGVSTNIEDLLGSSLSALKDIIGTEASQTEARVLAGTTDHSAFGNITLRIDAEASISVTYVLTVPPGEELPLDMIPFVDEFARAFGYQLLQISLLKRYVESGKQLRHDAIAWAFINAALVAHLSSKELPTLAQELEINLSKILQEILDKSENLAPMTDLKDPQYLLAHEEYWGNEFLTPSFVYSIRQQLVDGALWKAADEHTLPLLLYRNPREIKAHLEAVLNKLLERRYKNPEDIVIGELKNLIGELGASVLQDVPLSSSHSYKSVIRERAIRAAIAHATARSPLLVLRYLRRSKILQAFDELYRAYKIDDISIILNHAIQSEVPERARVPMQAFISSFVEALGEQPLSEGGWIALRSFLTSLGERIENVIENASTYASQIGRPDWAKEIQRNLRQNPQEKLPLAQVEEAQAIWKAIGIASMNALATLIRSEYLGNPPTELGNVVKQIIRTYHGHAQYILATSLALKIIRPLIKMGNDIDMTLPSVSTLLLLEALKSNQLSWKTTRVKQKRRFFFFKDPWKVKIGKETKEIWELLDQVDQLYRIESQEKITPIKELEQDPLSLVNGLVDFGTLTKAIQLTFVFHVNQQIIAPLLKVMKKKQTKRSPKDAATLLRMVYSPNKNGKNNILTQFLKKAEKAVSRYMEKLEETRNRGGDEKVVLEEARIALLEIARKSAFSLGKQLKSNAKQFGGIFEVNPEDFVLRFRRSTSGILMDKNELARIIAEFEKRKNPTLLSNDLPHLLRATFANALLEPVPESIIADVLPVLSRHARTANGRKVSRLYDLLAEINLRINDLILAIRDLVNEIENQLVANDAPIAVEKSSVFVELFSVKTKDVPNRSTIERLLPYEEIELDNFAGKWIGRIRLLRLEHFRSEVPLLVTLSDVVRYDVLRETREQVNMVYSGIGLVLKYLSREAPNELSQIRENLENAVFFHA